MERYARFVTRHAGWFLATTLAVTVLLATQLQHLHLEIRLRAVLPMSHPNVQTEFRLHDLFGGGGYVVVGVLANQGTVFTPAVLSKISRMTDRLAAAPGVVPNSVIGLGSPNTMAVSAVPGGDIQIERLMPAPPTSEAAVGRVRAAVHEDELLKKTLLSPDERAARTVLEFREEVPDAQVVQTLLDAIGPERDDDVRIAIIGGPVARAALADYTSRMILLLPLAILIIGVVHYEAFRTLQAMFLPLLTAVLSVVWALGLTGSLRLPLDSWTAISPVVILAIAAGHAVQIMKRYYEEYAVCGDNREAVTRALVAVGPVMLVAGIIAAAGFLSLLSFDVASVRAFGMLMALGITSALVIELTFTPALRSLLPPPKSRELRLAGAGQRMHRALLALSEQVIARPGTVFALALLVVGVFGLGALRITVDNNFLWWFPRSAPVRTDTEMLDRIFDGSRTLTVLVEGEADNTMQDPEVVRAIADLSQFIRAEPGIGSVTSVADPLMRLNQVMHEGRSDAYGVPDNRNLIAQYFLLYSLSGAQDSLSSLVDASYRYSAIRAFAKDSARRSTAGLLRRVDDFARQRFHGLPAMAWVAGGALGVDTALDEVVTREKVRNVVQISTIIAALSALVLGSVLGGIAVLLPLLVGLLATLGFIGWTGMWFDMATAAITAMGISIGADLSLYLIFRLRESLRESGSLEEAIRRSLTTSGEAIFFVASALVCGYSAFILSGFSLWIRLGTLTAVMISASALATVVMVPCLVALTRPRFLRPAGVGGEAALSAR